MNLIPRYCLKDAQLSALNIQAEEVHCGKVHGGEKGVQWQTLDVHHSSHRGICELATTQHPRALAVVANNPADCRSLHHLKLHFHFGLLCGETHISGMRPETASVVSQCLLLVIVHFS